MTKKKSKSFLDIYNDIDNISPRTRFVQSVAKATAKSENTVKMWLYRKSAPDELTQKILAEYLGVPVDGLFDNNNKKQKCSTKKS